MLEPLLTSGAVRSSACASRGCGSRRRPLPRPSSSPHEDGIAQPLSAFLLALVGAVAFVAGATLGLWPVWGAGMLAVCAAVLAYRP